MSGKRAFAGYDDGRGFNAAGAACYAVFAQQLQGDGGAAGVEDAAAVRVLDLCVIQSQHSAVPYDIGFGGAALRNRAAPICSGVGRGRRVPIQPQAADRDVGPALAVFAVKIFDPGEVGLKPYIIRVSLSRHMRSVIAVLNGDLPSIFRVDIDSASILKNTLMDGDGTAGDLDIAPGTRDINAITIVAADNNCTA